MTTSVVGDFNGDGIADIATLRTAARIWFVLLGQTMNTFLADSYGNWNGFGNGSLHLAETRWVNVSRSAGLVHQNQPFFLLPGADITAFS